MHPLQRAANEGRNVLPDATDDQAATIEAWAAAALNVDDARLLVLGQIVVVRERLDRLERELARQPFGAKITNEITDALGNLSLQMGALLGHLNEYQGANR